MYKVVVDIVADALVRRSAPVVKGVKEPKVVAELVRDDGFVGAVEERP